VKNLNDILPIFSVDKDLILSKMGDITIGVSCELPEIFTLSSDEFAAFHQAWVKAIKLLPVGCILYKQDWFMEEKFKADFSGDKSFLSRSSERFFNERPYLDHRCYLFLTRKPRGRVQPNSMFSTLLRKHIVPDEILDQSFLAEFISVVGQFEKILFDSGFIKLHRLRDEALNKVISQYWNLGSDGSIRDLSFENGIQVGEKYCELFVMSDVNDLPGVCGSRINYDKYSTDKTKFSIGFATPLGQLLSCNHIYSQYILIEDTHATIKKLESKKLRLQSLSAYSRSNAMARIATEDFLNEAVGSGRLPVKAHFNILAWTDDKEELREIRNRCSSALTTMDATPNIETVGAPQIFWAGIPGNAADLPINETFDTFSNQACCFLNLETNYRNSVSPIGIRLGDRISGMPLHVDISDEPMERGIITNRNKIVIGPSGSGKSFLTNHGLRSYCEAGSHIVVVDMGHSYKGLCEMMKGYYFTYSEKEPIRFNPFYLEEGAVLDTEKKESIKTLLLALWKKDDESFFRSEYVALSNALQLYYEKDVPYRCFDSFYEFLQTDFVERLHSDKVKDKDFDVSNFLYVLRPYYKGGEFDYLLNANENLDLLGQPFIVFEIDTIKDHPILFPVVTIIIMELFISKMRRLQGVRKIILIEEAWKAIAKAGMADYIKYLFKTVRKYFGEAIVVTQEIEDILSSEIVKQSIINNADCKILLDQSKYQNKFDEVQSLLGLTDKEKAMVLSINKANDPLRKYKEVFISLGGIVSKVYRVEVSREEYLTYTTEEREKIKVWEAAKKYGSMERGIKSIVFGCLLFISVSIQAQVPVVGTIVKAIDLKVQQLQNEALVLQNLQKLIENKLHELKLAEISSWSQKQKDLYRQYFDELKQVRPSIDSLFTRKKN
jgi:conjugation system TraG family ATPase